MEMLGTNVHDAYVSHVGASLPELSAPLPAVKNPPTKWTGQALYSLSILPFGDCVYILRHYLTQQFYGTELISV